MNRLQEKYTKEAAPKLKEEFGIKNIMAVPKLVKVVINMGIGVAAKNKEQKEALTRDIATISGQVPSIRKARVSIASFSLRYGMPVGLAVTLRRDRMYSFLDRLFSVVMPRLRDFRGVSKKSLDKSGNYTLGVTEHTIFPEIDAAKAATPHGMEIIIVTSSKNPAMAERLLELMGMPFEK
jgi:large subunit ribosomal protein L5